MTIAIHVFYYACRNVASYNIRPGESKIELVRPSRVYVTACVSRGVASNEAEEAVASSLFCARTRARIGDITSACMREVNYITMTDLTRAINRDLTVGKGPAALITTFFTKRGRKLIFFIDILYIYVPLTKCALFS